MNRLPALGVFDPIINLLFGAPKASAQSSGFNAD